MQDRLQAMQIFLRVADLKSFTKAAADLGLSKTHVSNLVAQLEAHLGARLLHRTTRSVTLTQDGSLFVERCQPLLAEVQEVETLFQTSPGQLAGSLRVDMPIGLALGLVLPNLGDFLDRHPKLKVELSSSDRRVDLVAEGFDCVVRGGPVVDQGLIARHLADMAQCNCASPAYLARFGNPQSLNDLAGHRVVHYSQVLGAAAPEFEFQGQGGLESFPMDAVLTVNQSDSYIRACLAGLGIIQNPRHSVQPLLDSGQLVEILPKFRPPPLPLWLLYPHRRHLSKRLQAFAGWLEGLLRERL
ncbi:LysR family transcriptional regulator [Gallaecimonas kandeliae]|uniref:LysR substrate-binding domain-containing protein n=1 Tax=Gallaecimonas kandeliae TaxID=3029055 RepID=UPI002649D77C|nr:LysR family transcriptional regulator [Gallaecimonas kandeliae]WKE67016.1 LysR family transcriptional regulator [Gallaecimonas kandeliae]